MKKLLTIRNIIICVTYILCVLAFVGVIIYVSVTNLSWMKLGSLIGGLVALNLIWVISLIFKIRTPVYLHIYWLVLVSICVILGNVFGFFDTMPWFNKVLHGISGAVLTVFGFTIGLFLFGNQKLSELKFGKSFLLITIFAFCFSLALGLFWEIFEFTVDSIIGENMQRWRDKNASTPPYESGLVDTMWDTIVHTCGAIVVALVGYFYLRKREDDKWFLIEKKEKNMVK